MPATIVRMRNNLPPPATPLLDILRQLDSAAKRKEFADLAGTSVAYLYQLAGCARRSCRTLLAKGIADASVVMNERYGTPVLTMSEVATMCALPTEKG